MKALLFFAMALACVAHGQGTVIFSNSGSVAARVYVCDETGVYLVPPGSTTYRVALFYADDGITDEARFLQIGASVGFGPVAGYFSGGGRTVPTAILGDWVMFQVRAWESAYGSSYQEVQAGGQGKIGKSNIVRVDTALPDSDVVAYLVQSGLQGFVIASPTCIPEPLLASWILGLLSILLWLRRSKLRRTILS